VCGDGTDLEWQVERVDDVADVEEVVAVKRDLDGLREGRLGDTVLEAGPCPVLVQQRERTKPLKAHVALRHLQREY